jgi:acyl-CoA thioesterase-1
VDRRQSLVILAAGLIWVLIITGCGQSSNSTGTRSAPTKEERVVAAPSSSSSPAARTIAHDKDPVIVTFGDSLTQGVAGKSYPDYLQDLLDRNGYSYRVDNQGVSGDTSSDGLGRIDNVIAAHPALVILEFGGNDGLRGVPIESTRKHLEEMISRLKQANIPVALAGITLPPNYGPDYVKPFTAMFPELAREYHLRLLPFLLVHVYQHPEMMQPDGIHPNGRGNEVLAEDVFELVRPLLKRDRNKKIGILFGMPRSTDRANGPVASLQAPSQV